jgi:hypothetical protein
MLKLDTEKKERKTYNLSTKIEQEATQKKEKYLSIPHRGNHHGNRYCYCFYKNKREKVKATYATEIRKTA